MTPSTELFDLIKSLSKSEKRYIQLNFSIHKGDKNYLQLFNAIEKQHEYKEAELKKKFSKEHFIKRLPVAKAYLYSNLLKVLRQYYASSSAEVRIKEMMHEVEILMNKGLFSQAHKIVLRAKKIAIEYEKTLLFVEIIRCESRLLGLIFFISKKSTSPLQLIDEEDEAFYRLNTSNLYRKLSWRIADTVVKTGITNNKQLKEELKKIDTSALRFLPKNSDFDTKLYYYHTTGNYYRALGENKEFYDNMRELLLLFEINPKQIEESPYSFLAVLNNFIHAASLNKKHEDALRHLKKIKQIEFSSKLKYVLVFETVLRIETTIHASLEKYSEVIKLVVENEKLLEDFELDKTQLHLFRIYFNASWSYFNLNKYANAIKYVNKIVNDRTVKNNIDLRLQSELLNMMIHYEMGNFDLLDSLIKSQRTLIKKKYKHNLFHLMVLNLFAQLKDESGDVKKIFKSGLDQLGNMANDQEAKNALSQCEFFLHWIKKKTTF